MINSGGICARVLSLMMETRRKVHVMSWIEADHVCFSLHALSP
jgi:hypothetical protein